MIAKEKVLLGQMQTIVRISGTRVSDFEIDKKVLGSFPVIPPFVWLVRKFGTHLYIANHCVGDYELSAFEYDWGITNHQTYFLYDGNRLKQVYKEQAINFIKFGEV